MVLALVQCFKWARYLVCHCAFLCLICVFCQQQVMHDTVYSLESIVWIWLCLCIWYIIVYEPRQ